MNKFDRALDKEIAEQEIELDNIFYQDAVEFIVEFIEEHPERCLCVEKLVNSQWWLFARRN